MTNLIRYPNGFGQKDIVAWGTTGLVCLDVASQTVVKTAHDDDNLCRIEVERLIYERFQQYGGHSGLLRYHGPYDLGIRLEYAPNWRLSTFLRKHPEVRVEQRLRWARQVTDALRFAHDANVIHGDLTLNNVFLTQDLDAKLADFGGSSLDGSDLLVVVNASHRYLGSLLSTNADLFALGSVLYHVMTGNLPYQDLSEREDKIRAFFEKGEFPETDSLGPVGAIITKCWQVKYKSAIDVRKDIEVINQHKSIATASTIHSFQLHLSVSLLAIGIVAAITYSKIRARIQA